MKLIKLVAIILLLMNANGFARIEILHKNDSKVNSRIYTFAFAKNWSYSLRIYLAIDFIAKVLQEKVSLSKDKKEWFAEAETAIVEESKKIKLTITDLRDIDVEHLPNFSFCSISGRIVLIGLRSKHRTDKRFSSQRVAFFMPGKEEIEAFGNSKSYAVMSSGEKLFGLCPTDPYSFIFLDSELRETSKIKLADSLFIRRIWELSDGDYLVMHLPFNSGYHFSIVDKKGKSRKSFYADYRDGEFDLRAYLLDNVIMADYLDGRLYLSRVYPLTGQLELEEIDIEKESRRVFKADIEGFSGQHRNFRKASINSLGEAMIAAVNGVFVTSGRIYVSLGLNHKTRGGAEHFSNFLYVFNRAGAFLGQLEIPYGPVLHYNRTSGDFLSLRDYQGANHDRTIFSLFKLRE